VLQLFGNQIFTMTNTELDILPDGFRMVRGFAGFGLSEATNGHLDLNSDGDGEDVIFVAAGTKSALLRIPGFGLPDFASAAPDPELFLFGVPEGESDHNGDGDTLDSIATLYDPSVDRTLDTGLAIERGGKIVRAGRWMGVSVEERSQGGLDLDRDGRDESTVPHVVDTVTGQSVNLGFPGAWLGALDDQLLARRVVVQDGTVVESELVAWDLRTHRAVHTGVDVAGLCGTLGDKALFLSHETFADLDGDGDLADDVLAVYDARTGTVENLGLAAPGAEAAFAPNGQAAVLVSEPQQGADLNDDGDQLDRVLFHVFLDPPRG